MASKQSKKKILNFNVGVLGHIDSGKTSLAKALSTVTSTAAFDKNPQSRERGITLDLGFSSFSIPTPPHLTCPDFERVQFTLVDCPGHASLIKTIIGGAQIIDLMLLVVDSTKGMQTQTAECLVIGEITCPHLIVVLNKVDLLPLSTRDSQIEKLKKKFSKTLASTRFSGAPIVAVSAIPDAPQGIDELIQVLSESLYLPVRNSVGPFLFSVDHCFAIRGQGTVMTGTVLSGSIVVNEMIEIPGLKLSKKVKSMQMFHEPVECAAQGDRLGICVTQFDPSLVERCVVSCPGYLQTTYAAVMKVFKIPYFKSECKSGGKFHVTVGHETVMAKATFFSSVGDGGSNSASENLLFSKEFLYQEFLSDSGSIASHLQETSSIEHFVLLEFERPIICPVQSKVIGSRLDCDAFSNKCRIAFHGTLIETFTKRDYESSALPQIRIFKPKRREGFVDRIQDDHSVIGRSLFKKETRIDMFVSMKVELSTGECGVIEGAFGTSGKFRVTVPDGLSAETIQMFTGRKKQKATGESASGGDDEIPQRVTIILNFKRYIFDPCKRMSQ